MPAGASPLAARGGRSRRASAGHGPIPRTATTISYRTPSGAPKWAARRTDGSGGGAYRRPADRGRHRSTAVRSTERREGGGRAAFPAMTSVMFKLEPDDHVDDDRNRTRAPNSASVRPFRCEGGPSPAPGDTSLPRPTGLHEGDDLGMHGCRDESAAHRAAVPEVTLLSHGLVPENVDEIHTGSKPTRRVRTGRMSMDSN